MRLSSLLSAAVLCFVGQQANAWWDEGHMLVGAIAREELGDEAAKFEAVLAEFDQYYPGFGRLDTSAVWADHIKCSPDARNPGFVAPYCMGQERLEGLGIFDDLHFVTFLHNPLNVTLKPMDQNMPRPTGNAPWLIEESLKGLKLQNGGTVFSWNIFLRMLTHMVGDLHMPLHTTSSVSTWFGGSSDAGGNKVWITGLPIRGVDNLHKLWDSVGGAYPNNFPKADLDNLAKEASKLVQQFPRKMFGDRVNTLAAWDIAKESRQIARKIVYRELEAGFSTPRDFKTDPYIPSKQYVDEMVPLCQQQITLAGYRLADMLRATLPYLPPMPKKHHDHDGGHKKSGGSGETSDDMYTPDSDLSAALPGPHHHSGHSQGMVSANVAIGLLFALVLSLLGNLLMSKKIADQRMLIAPSAAAVSSGITSEGLLAGQQA